jgi:hypothetical protein
MGQLGSVAMGFEHRERDPNPRSEQRRRPNFVDRANEATRDGRRPVRLEETAGEVFELSHYGRPAPTNESR